MKIALYQMCSKLDYRENLSKVSEAAKSAADQGAHYLFLPECFYSMSDGRSPSPHLVSDKNEHFTNISQVAKENELYLLGGSVAYKEGGKILNRSLNFSPKGELIGSYDKIHLFNCDLVKKSVNEADIYAPGKEPLLLTIDGHKLGINICFDLRFPEMGREYARAGAEILTYASAFTIPTGKAHWHTLVKARAIENQCFVIAAAQTGQHNERVTTYGHSLVVNPWGEVLLDAGKDEGLHILELPLEFVETVRKRIKVF